MTQHTSPTYEIFSPLDGKSLIHRDNTTESEFADVVTNATEAFEVWKKVPIYQRAELLDIIGQTIIAHEDELAERVSQETGKMYSESQGDVSKALSYIKDTSYQIKQGKLFVNLTIDEEKGKGELTLDAPQGVVGVIAPSNYPIALSVQSIALALGAGDSVIVKPHEQCGYSDLLMQEIHAKALAEWNQTHPLHPVPETLIQHVYSGDAAMGILITRHTDIPLVTFVGSSQIGKIIHKNVHGRGGKVIVEAGGNAPFIITSSTQKPTNDYPADFHLKAVDEAIKGAIIACGQRCSTPRRVFIEKGGKEAEMLAKFRTEYTQMDDESLYSTDPRNTKMGPLLAEGMFDEAQAIRTKLMQETGVEIIGGTPILRDSGGFYMTPMLVIVPEGQQIDEMRRETFAPILYVQLVDELGKCLDKANNVENQLTGGVWTKKPEVVIERLSGKLLVNQLIINGSTSGSGKNYGGMPGVGFIGTDPKVSQFYSTTSTTIIAPADTIRKKFGSL